MFRRQRAAILERDEPLKRYVVDRLAEGWTPEQIAGYLKRGIEIGLQVVSAETIYAFGAMLEPMAHAPLTLSKRSEGREALAIPDATQGQWRTPRQAIQGQDHRQGSYFSAF